MWSVESKIFNQVEISGRGTGQGAAERGDKKATKTRKWVQECPEGIRC